MAVIRPSTVYFGKSDTDITEFIDNYVKEKFSPYIKRLIRQDMINTLGASNIPPKVQQPVEKKVESEVTSKEDINESVKEIVSKTLVEYFSNPQILTSILATQTIANQHNADNVDSNKVKLESDTNTDSSTSVPVQTDDSQPAYAAANNKNIEPEISMTDESNASEDSQESNEYADTMELLQEIINNNSIKVEDFNEDVIVGDNSNQSDVAVDVADETENNKESEARSTVDTRRKRRLLSNDEIVTDSTFSAGARIERRKTDSKFSKDIKNLLGDQI
ncbi:hypothetical protein [Clostridium tertium]|uniref:hypothetical protein n=1 Tax=Clostridium tertium TaxID=1559 RepID=UPI0023B2A5DE|nr:hypothetical protein [Clostridium tertium]